MISINLFVTGLMMTFMGVLFRAVLPEDVSEVPTALAWFIALMFFGGIAAMVSAPIVWLWLA